MSKEVLIQLVIAAPSLIANAGVIIKMFLDNAQANKQRQALAEKVEATHIVTADLAVKVEAHMKAEDENR